MKPLKVDTTSQIDKKPLASKTNAGSKTTRANKKSLILEGTLTPKKNEKSERNDSVKNVEV